MNKTCSTSLSQKTNYLNAAYLADFNAWNALGYANKTEEIPSYDFILRLQPDSQSITTTSDFREFVELAISKRTELLERVVKNLWRNHKYQEEYESYLLDEYDEEEFMEIAKKFATRYEQEPEKSILIQEIQTVLNIIDEELTSSDISFLINYKPQIIERLFHETSTSLPESDKSSDSL